MEKIRQHYNLDIKPDDEMKEKPVVMKQLFLYPVRGIKGMEVEYLELTPLGFRHDRNWITIDAKTLQFVVNKNTEMMTYLR